MFIIIDVGCVMQQCERTHQYFLVKNADDVDVVSGTAPGDIHNLVWVGHGLETVVEWQHYARDIADHIPERHLFVVFTRLVIFARCCWSLPVVIFHSACSGRGTGREVNEVSCGVTQVNDCSRTIPRTVTAFYTKIRFI